MVKAEAGVLETDDPARAEEKVRATIEGLVSDPAAAQWLGRNLRPLVGLEAAGEAGADRRGEAFAAWRGFFEALAGAVVRSYSSSRTSTSPTTACSTSSTISSTGRPASRC